MNDQNGVFIFKNKEMEKEWNDLDPLSKKLFTDNLQGFVENMESKLSIIMLFHVINDLQKEVQILEKDLHRLIDTIDQNNLQNINGKTDDIKKN